MVTGVVPSPPRFLPSIFIAHRVQHSHCSSILHRVLLTHALALSASQFVHMENSQRIYTSMHSAGLELAKLTYTRLEVNLIRHRGDRHVKKQASPKMRMVCRPQTLACPWLKYGPHESEHKSTTMAVKNLKPACLRAHRISLFSRRISLFSRRFYSQRSSRQAAVKGVIPVSRPLQYSPSFLSRYQQEQ